MVPITALWLPILVSAVIVFVASSLIHMVLAYHHGDLRKVPDEDAAFKAFRGLNLPPGDYALPCASSTRDLKNPDFVAKMAKGPVVVMTVQPGGPMSMGSQLTQWFGYCLLVGVFAAYIAGRALTSESHYLAVFRFAGATAFCGYSLALMQQSIWYKKSWRATLLSMADGLIYALLTAGTFGWLWPR